MNVLVLTNSCSSLPCLELLAERKLLSALFAPLPASTDTHALCDWAAAREVPFFWIGKETLEAELHSFCSEFREHLVLTFGFPWRIPSSLLGGKPRFFNMHFSLLPAFAGAMPLFWQLRDGHSGGVTLHQLTPTLDAGPIAGKAPVALLPGENAGLYAARLAVAAVPLLHGLIDGLTAGTGPVLEPQPKEGRSGAPRATADDLFIHWDRQGARDVELLVNAANPDAGGAIAFLRGQPVRILEVSPASGAVPAGTPGGSIIHADTAQGLFVACADGGLLRLNVLRLREGWFSGSKLSVIGIRAGDRFDPAPLPQHALYSPSFTHH